MQTLLGAKHMEIKRKLTQTENKYTHLYKMHSFQFETKRIK